MLILGIKSNLCVGLGVISDLELGLAQVGIGLRFSSSVGMCLHLGLL